MTRRWAYAALAAGLAACAPAGAKPGTLAPRARVIAMNSEGQGLLSEGDPRLNDGSLYQDWRFTGSAGQQVRIDVMSNSFDAFAILQTDDGSELARDDDGGEGLNARITYTLPRTGSYRIIANTYRSGSFGPYTLRLTALGNQAWSGGGKVTETAGSIARGQTIRGRLGPSDPRLDDRSVYHAYSFVGRAGESIQVDVVSTDFDAFCMIQNTEGQRLASDDDSGGRLNARVVFTLPYSGVYRIIANTYHEGSYGAYTISVR